MTQSPDAPLDRFRLAERISDWIDALELQDDDARMSFATGLAAAMAAADESRRRLEALLRTAPLKDAGEADRALQELTELHLQLTSELPEQVDAIADSWTVVEDRLIELSPDDAA
jgi:hypothetical protein